MTELFRVEYKPVGKTTEKTIVRAKDKEAAALNFNNPAEIGLEAEIKKVVAVKSIPTGWVVRTESNPFVTYRLNEALSVDSSKFYGYRAGDGVKVELNLADVVSASLPSRDKGRMKTWI